MAELRRDEVKLPAALISNAKPDDLTRLEQVIREADFRRRRCRDTWAIRANVGPDEPHIRLRPLQRRDGTFTKDAVYWLTETSDLLPTHEAERTVQEFNEALADWNIVSRGPQHDMELGILSGLDPLPILKDFASEHTHLRFYRVLPTDKLKKREGLWRIVTASSDQGETWANMRQRQKLPEDVFGGLLAAQWPAMFVSIPLVARNQPLAMVFRTAQGAQILAITTKNFSRVASLGSWPVGGGVTGIGGQGGGVYATSFKRFPEEYSESLLFDTLAGANRLLERLTNFAWWKDTDGFVDAVERNIAWSSTLYGLETILEVAREWNTSEALWTAFRALTMLEGLWPRPKLLLDLLNPDNVLRCAIATFPNEVHKRWAMEITTNYEREVLSVHQSRDLATCVAMLGHVRHLLHGTGVNSRLRRAERLEALRATKDAEVQLIKDIATFWWSSMLFSPESHAPPTANPFAT